MFAVSSTLAAGALPVASRPRPGFRGRARAPVSSLNSPMMVSSAGVSGKAAVALRSTRSTLAGRPVVAARCVHRDDDPRVNQPPGARLASTDDTREAGRWGAGREFQWVGGKGSGSAADDEARIVQWAVTLAGTDGFFG